MKNCSKCGELLSLDNFYKDKKAKDGLRSYCKKCQNSQVRDYYNNNEEYRKYKIKYGEDNREKLCKYRIEYHKRNDNGERDRYLCRIETRRLLRIGEIKKENCVICNDKETVAHHSDYTKPDKVMWLCKKHHVEIHRDLKK